MVGPVSPWGAIARAIGRQEEDRQGQDTIDQESEEFLRGRIHPVQVLQNQDEGATAALLQEQGLQCDKDLPLLQLGPLVGHGRAVDLDGQQRQEGRGELLCRKSRLLQGHADPLHHRWLGLPVFDLTARLQQVDERQVGDDPAIGETPPCQECHILASEGLLELVDQPGFPHARLTDHARHLSLATLWPAPAAPAGSAAHGRDPPAGRDIAPPPRPGGLSTSAPP